MRLAEVIGRLTDLLRRHGDMEVRFAWDRDDETTVEVVERMGERVVLISHPE